MNRLIRAIKHLFRIRWVVKPPVNTQTCGYCAGTGQYDSLYQTPVRPGEENVRTSPCPECTGLGFHKFRE